ncbi:FMN-linked oxidoreductase [Dichomitus squalens LYAD-421 SS1]|uniref:FMN-linked oxidoreductase n=1 Tax=Dichomitus squalens (strain LYAD-421) TaxID=732165 RepID=UPI0004415279|nr:FMN-linked oxidoreductase [Dichomitus squalens LYAD-421 SS1]EJF67476.1 FMN-linked oxidoreductase [Dichomitus squalens LYAD-421 SS1]
MSRRSHPSSPDSSPRTAKRQKREHTPLSPDDYKGGLMLAPMVRSGALPTRLYALKHGAKLVWGPETVDKAILHTTRVVDPVTGVVAYHGKSKPIFTCHPIEKPFLIYQIGSADPELAVQAAKMVQQDVAGFDLNCGCPKPFSTHSGMGAALLTTPDLLCSILTALREAMPPEISISAKIRLLPSQEDTLKLVERIVNTGISCLTVHCRTRNMRMREKAVIERLREIVDFVEKMGKGIAVIENGDCLGYEDSKRVRQVTGAHSVMIATAAEANPTCFSPTPLKDLELTFVPGYIRLGKYLNNHWSSTKFCATQFQGAHDKASRTDLKALREAIVHAKGYEDMEQYVAPWTGEQEFTEIVEAIEKRGGQRAPPMPVPWEDVVVAPLEAIEENGQLQDTEVVARLHEPRSDGAATAPFVRGAVLGLEIPSVGGGGETIAVQ